MDMTYDSELAVNTYNIWRRSSIFYVLFEHVNLNYFGNLKLKSVVEFACGDGWFLKKCLAEGAGRCLGLDLNEKMMNFENDNTKNNRLLFSVQNAFEPIKTPNNYCQFDFAVGHFVLHHCANERELSVFIENLLDLLKPGGKVFLSLSPFMPTIEDKEIIADYCGYEQPPVENNDDPYYVPYWTLYPANASVSKTLRPFTRKHLFTASDYNWSGEKLILNLRKAGFVNVELLQQAYPENALSFEVERMKSLHASVILIGAEKGT